jgi:Transposase and inactivated derivatives
MTSQMVTDALIMAIWRRGRPKELLHHSDQGSQYTSEPFQRLLADHGITCSMSRSGNVWEFKTVRADVFDYIERFYNPTRRHSTIGYLSPMTFEERAMKA